MLMKLTTDLSFCEMKFQVISQCIFNYSNWQSIKLLNIEQITWQGLIRPLTQEKAFPK